MNIARCFDSSGIRIVGISVISNTRRGYGLIYYVHVYDTISRYIFFELSAVNLPT